MEKHIHLLGLLYVILNILGLIAAIVTFMILAGVGVASQDAAAMTFLSGLGFVIALFIAVLSIPGLLGGYGLLKLYPWSRMLVLILSILNLLNFPFGTALGIYGIWILTNAEAVAILEQRRRPVMPPAPQ